MVITVRNVPVYPAIQRPPGIRITGLAQILTDHYHMDAFLETIACPCDMTMPWFYYI